MLNIDLNLSKAETLVQGWKARVNLCLTYVDGKSKWI